MNYTLDDSKTVQSPKELPNENVEHEFKQEKAIFEEKNIDSNQSK